MKKLILVLLLAIYCPLVSAQEIELEGKFDARLPQAQVWDGRYLGYTFRSSAFFYDTETDQLHEEPNQQLAYMNYKKGLYLRKVEDKYQLRRVGVEEPIMPYLLSTFTGWFGDSFLGWEELTGPNAGIYAIWYEMGNGVIARHKLADIHRALGFEPEKEIGFWNFGINRAFNTYTTMYHEGLIALKNPKTEKYQYFDLELKSAFHGEFEGADPFFEGLASVQNQQGLWGFIDSGGVIRIPFIYRQKPGPFHSGLAMVIDRKNQIGFIDQNGVLKIQANYSEATHFYKGKSIAMRAGLGGYRVILSTDGTEEKFPCESCMTQKSLFGTELNSNYYPRQDIRDIMDEGKLILQKGFQRMIINLNNQPLSAELAMIKDIIEGKAIVVEGRYLDNDFKQRFFLWDLKSNKPVIELSFKEF
jgi:hypothetical protein